MCITPTVTRLAGATHLVQFETADSGPDADHSDGLPIDPTAVISDIRPALTARHTYPYPLWRRSSGRESTALKMRHASVRARATPLSIVHRNTARTRRDEPRNQSLAPVCAVPLGPGLLAPVHRTMKTNGHQTQSVDGSTAPRTPALDAYPAGKNCQDLLLCGPQNDTEWLMSDTFDHLGDCQ